MKIAIANDHTGAEHKLKIKKKLENKKITVINYGTDNFESVDYPDFAHKVAQDVNVNKVDLGILICGSANGVAMTANKYKNVRAGLCWKKEIVSIIKKHNDANILCIPARYTSVDQVLEMVEIFISTEFEGGRHKIRVDKIGRI